MTSIAPQKIDVPPAEPPKIAVTSPRRKPLGSAQRRHRPRTKRASPALAASSSPQLSAQTQAQAQLDPGVDGAENVEDQMDWLGGRLAVLIEEGKRALGREVVVQSEAREDEVDDGRGGWEEEGEFGEGRRRPRNLQVSTYGSASSRTSPRAAGFDLGSAPSSSVPVPAASMGRRGFEPEVVVSGSWRERVRADEGTWESAEMRELMERAQARARAAGVGGGGS